MPIEVKAEQNIRSHSLKTYYEKFQPEEAVRFSTLKYKERNWMGKCHYTLLQLIRRSSDPTKEGDPHAI